MTSDLAKTFQPHGNWNRATKFVQNIRIPLRSFHTRQKRSFTKSGQKWKKRNWPFKLLIAFCGRVVVQIPEIRSFSVLSALLWMEIVSWAGGFVFKPFLYWLLVGIYPFAFGSFFSNVLNIYWGRLKSLCLNFSRVCILIMQKIYGCRKRGKSRQVKLD